jgi:hypothetical protein
MSDQPKIFQIGFNRCGTKTLHMFFLKNGLSSVHWDKGRLAVTMYQNILLGRRLLAGYEHYGCFTDMENALTGRFFFEGYKLYPQLLRAFPNAYFILNTRDMEKWIQSRMKHEGGRYKEHHKSIWRVSTDEALANVWRREWRRHHADVNEFFRGHPRFMVFDIEADAPRSLAEFLAEFELDPAHYGWEREWHPAFPSSPADGAVPSGPPSESGVATVRPAR